MLPLTCCRSCSTHSGTAHKKRVLPQVSALFHIASSKGPPPLPEQLSPAGREFLLLCFNRRAPVFVEEWRASV